MAIDNLDKIDAIGIDKVTGIVTLAISDHLDWEDSYHHLITLQSKINKYLSFIESGEIYDSYPYAKGREITIRVVKKYKLSKEGSDFTDAVKKIVNDAGFGFESVYLEHQ